MTVWINDSSWRLPGTEKEGTVMRQIIAMGGGGFSMEPDNPLLDEYVLRQSRRVHPKVCFLPTASGDAEGYIERFYEAFRRFDCEPAETNERGEAILFAFDYPGACGWGPSWSEAANRLRLDLRMTHRRDEQ